MASSPSAAKWNILGTNDASFNDGSGIANGAIQSNPNVLNADATDIGFYEIGRTTLSSAGDTITVSSLPARKYLKIIVSILATGGTVDGGFTFNSDSGSNYTRRVSVDGGADSGATSQTSTSVLQTAAATPAFGVFDIVNISAQEKLMMGHSIGQGTAGAGNNVNRREHAYKWANTSAQISTVTLSNFGTGDFAIGSEVVVLGHN